MPKPQKLRNFTGNYPSLDRRVFSCHGSSNQNRYPQNQILITHYIYEETNMPMSPEQKARAQENLRLARERKQQLKSQRETIGAEPEASPPNEPQPPYTPRPENQGEASFASEAKISSTEYLDLLRQVAELKRQIAAGQGGYQPTPPPPPPYSLQQPQVNSRGQLTGIFEKYVVDPKNYPDPKERLAREPRLARFAFDINYDLNFTVGLSQYQTQDGVNTREPKFTLELVKVVMDEDTGEPTDGRYVICNAIFHEDPQAALTVAREQGLPVTSDQDEKAFLDEMRYIRMRDWLFEAFYPPKPTTGKKKKEMVIGNKIVDYYEVNSEESTSIPFGELKRKG